MKKLLVLIFIFLGFLTISVSAEDNYDQRNAAEKPKNYKEYRININQGNNRQKEYRFKYFPPKGGFISNYKYPTIIYLHGNNTSGTYYNRDSEPLFTVAPRRGYAVIMPEAQKAVWSNGRIDREKNGGNNVDTVVGNPAYDEDDMYFFKALLENDFENLNIDREQIFVIGTSSGGMMALKLAYMADHMINAPKLKGVAVFGGSVEHRFINGYRPRPVPYIHFHGKKDYAVEWSKPTGGWFSNRPATFGIDLWKQLNRADTLVKDRVAHIPYKDWRYTHKAFKSVRGGQSAPVEYYLFDKLIHNVQGKNDLTRTFYSLIFDFFEKHNDVKFLVEK
jgi:poly(3-hydroxybutyrate) depolymerase